MTAYPTNLVDLNLRTLAGGGDLLRAGAEAINRFASTLCETSGQAFFDMYIPEYDHFRLGLSDHTTHPTIAPCAAVALGARVIEKHMQGCSDYGCPQSVRQFGVDDTPDSQHSLETHEFADMVEAIRLTEKALGSSEKRIRESERPYLKYRRGPRGLRGA